jgi:hypothetical protein
LPSISSLSLITIKFYNLFVLKFMQYAGGVWESVCLLTLCVPRSFQRVFHLSPLFSNSCALFCATTAMQLFSNQFVAHSFRRHGGVVGGPFITSSTSAIGACGDTFLFHESPACPDRSASRITSHVFQILRPRRILLHFSRCSRTKIGSVILSPS